MKVELQREEERHKARNIARLVIHQLATVAEYSLTSYSAPTLEELRNIKDFKVSAATVTSSAVEQLVSAREVAEISAPAQRSPETLAAQQPDMVITAPPPRKRGRPSNAQKLVEEAYQAKLEKRAKADKLEQMAQ